MLNIFSTNPSGGDCRASGHGKRRNNTKPHFHTLMGMRYLRLNKVHLLPHRTGTSQHSATCTLEVLAWEHLQIHHGREERPNGSLLETTAAVSGNRKMPQVPHYALSTLQTHLKCRKKCKKHSQ
jgi:hypothetical protein